MGFGSGKTWIGNKNGRPKKPEIEELRIAIKQVESEKKQKFLRVFVEKAFADKSYAIALINKLVPDLKSVEGKMEVQQKILQIIGDGLDPLPEMTNEHTAD